MSMLLEEGGGVDRFLEVEERVTEAGVVCLLWVRVWGGDLALLWTSRTSRSDASPSLSSSIFMNVGVETPAFLRPEFFAVGAELVDPLALALVA